MILEKIEHISRPVIENTKTYECPSMTYAADLPGANASRRLRIDFTDRFRVVRKIIYQEIIKSKKKVLISSPYFIHNIKMRSLLNELLDHKLNVEIYTNSLGSTDAIYVASNFYRSVFRWQRGGCPLYSFRKVVS
jgi:putative cardiolipin synthase